MNSMTSWLFYLMFALVLVGMYLAVRRRWVSPGLAAGVGTLGSIISMFLVSLAQQNNILHAVVVSILVGALFSGMTLAIAWFFHSNDPDAQHRTRSSQAVDYTPQTEPSTVMQDEDY